MNMTLKELQTNIATLATDMEERDGVWHLTTEPAQVRALLEAIRPSFSFPEDLTCVDDGAMLRLLYRLYAPAHRQLLHVHLLLPRTGARVPTACDLWRGLEWHEREAYDMFGVVFTGHPDLRRILTWEGFQGYPLLKDFVVDNDDMSWQIPPQCEEEIVDLLGRA